MSNYYEKSNRPDQPVIKVKRYVCEGCNQKFYGYRNFGIHRQTCTPAQEIKECGCFKNKGLCEIHEANNW